MLFSPTEASQSSSFWQIEPLSGKDHWMLLDYSSKNLSIVLILVLECDVVSKTLDFDGKRLW